MRNNIDNGNASQEMRLNQTVADDGLSYGSFSEEEALSYASMQAGDIHNKDECFLPLTSSSSSNSDKTYQSDVNRCNSPWYLKRVDITPIETPEKALTLWSLTCNVLGFGSDPCQPLQNQTPEELEMERQRTNNTYSDLRLSLLSNFSTAYNILSVSLAIQMMSSVYDPSDSERAMCSSTLLAGMILGQIGGGALGDLIGRHRAMTFVMFLQVFASIGSTFACEIKVNFLLHDGHQNVVENIVFLQFWQVRNQSTYFCLVSTYNSPRSNSHSPCPLSRFTFKPGVLS